MDKRKWMCTAGQMSHNIPLTMEFGSGFWVLHVYTLIQAATWCSLSGTILIVATFGVHWLHQDGKEQREEWQDCTQKEKWDSVECWDTHLFLLVLALGAISGVRTYKLLFLGRCKLLSTVWLSTHNQHNGKSKCFKSTGQIFNLQDCDVRNKLLPHV